MVKSEKREISLKLEHLKGELNIMNGQLIKIEIVLFLAWTISRESNTITMHGRTRLALKIISGQGWFIYWARSARKPFSTFAYL